MNGLRTYLRKELNQWRLNIACVLAAYVGTYAVLSYFGGWGMTESGKERPLTYALAVTDCYIWQPLVGDCQLFVNIHGEKKLRGDGLGYFYAPLILLDQRFVHPTRYFDSPGIIAPKPDELHRLPNAHPFSWSPQPPVRETNILLTTALSMTVPLALVFVIYRLSKRFKNKTAAPLSERGGL